MQTAQIETEDQFSQKQFSNSKNIVTMTIIQLALISVIGLWQIWALRRFFKQKNLI